MMVTDHSGDKLQQLRSGLSLVIAPIQYLVSLPVQGIAWVDNSIILRNKINQENADLSTTVLLLKGRVQKYQALEKENRQLRALLQSNSSRRDRVVVAHLLSVANDPFTQVITLSVGKKQKVFVGQPVLDANGVMGQVIHVGAVTSQVLLLTDSDSAIPVQDTRNGLRAIAAGGGSQGLLFLNNIPKTVDIRIGDELITSGLGKRFPPGYPVGKVLAITQQPGAHFLEISVTPSAAIYQTRLVLLLWPE